MNHTKVIQALAANTQVSTQKCERIVDAYEKYGEAHFNRMSKKYIEEILSFIEVETGIEEDDCRAVMEQLFQLLNQQIKNKIPFMK